MNLKFYENRISSTKTYFIRFANTSPLTHILIYFLTWGQPVPVSIHHCLLKNESVMFDVDGNKLLTKCHQFNDNRLQQYAPNNRNTSRAAFSRDPIGRAARHAPSRGLKFKGWMRGGRARGPTEDWNAPARPSLVHDPLSGALFIPLFPRDVTSRPGRPRSKKKNIRACSQKAYAISLCSFRDKIDKNRIGEKSFSREEQRAVDRRGESMHARNSI